MSRIPLNFLPTFVAVAQLETLRAAADSLHLTHSAVSQQIAELESRIGFPLFDRRGRRVHLNAAGQALLRHVAPALARRWTTACKPPPRPPRGPRRACA